MYQKEKIIISFNDYQTACLFDKHYFGSTWPKEEFKLAIPNPPQAVRWEVSVEHPLGINDNVLVDNLSYEESCSALMTVIYEDGKVSWLTEDLWGEGFYSSKFVKFYRLLHAQCKSLVKRNLAEEIPYITQEVW